MSVISFQTGRQQPAASEAALRQDLAAAYRLLARFGWTEAIFNHVTLRLPGPEHHFLINPFGLLYDEITASSLVKIDLEGRPVGAANGIVNPAGFVLHSAIHAARPDAQCVIHTHTIAGMAIAQLRDGLDFGHFIAMQFHGRIGYHDFQGLPLEAAERRDLVASLGAGNIALILRNHGLVTVGASVGEAFWRMFNLERMCEAQLRAMATGQPRVLPESAVIARAAQQVRDLERPELDLAGSVFAAFKRKLDREAPDYRD
jgi:ribulose-5-phosphate 4-epimerase/fuculose-1-phosphate aldolase